MSKITKSMIGVIVIAFLIFYLYTRPEAAAEFVKTVFGIVDSVGRFFNRLVS